MWVLPANVSGNKKFNLNVEKDTKFSDQHSLNLLLQIENYSFYEIALNQ